MTPNHSSGTVYLVTNCLTASLVIHDIGVRLDAGGSKILPAQTYNASKIIQDYLSKGWVNVSQRSAPQKPPIPVWPLSKAPEPTPPTSPTPEKMSVDPTVLRLISDLKEMISTLASISTHSISTPVSIASSPVHKTEFSGEPVFIPKAILPENADVSINVAKSEIPDQDFDDGLEALKKARKK